jgi:hypothetical protein
MAESAALLVDEVLPREPMRQWLVSVPIPLRFLLVSRPVIMGHVLGIVYRVIAMHLIKKTGLAHKTARTGAVTLIQRFGSAESEYPFSYAVPECPELAGSGHSRAEEKQGTDHGFVRFI